MMNAEKKIRPLIFVIAFLLITNIVLLFFLFSDNKKDQHQSSEHLNIVGTFLHDKIGFDKQQMELYQNVRKADFEKGKLFFDSLLSAKNKFYKNIYNDTIPDSVINNIAATISERQAAVDIHMLKHFKNLRKICTPQQLPKFDSLFTEVAQKITSGRFRNNHH